MIHNEQEAAQSIGLKKSWHHVDRITILVQEKID